MEDEGTRGTRRGREMVKWHQHFHRVVFRHRFDTDQTGQHHVAEHVPADNFRIVQYLRLWIRYLRRSRDSSAFRTPLAMLR